MGGIAITTGGIHHDPPYGAVVTQYIYELLKAKTTDDDVRAQVEGDIKATIEAGIKPRVAGSVVLRLSDDEPRVKIDE
jgi:hypothetical protein